jgi:hypothetical protein
MKLRFSIRDLLWLTLACSLLLGIVSGITRFAQNELDKLAIILWIGLTLLWITNWCWVWDHHRKNP